MNITFLSSDKETYTCRYYTEKCLQKNTVFMVKENIGTIF